MDDQVLKMVGAGLLHDVGKFMQRAEVPLSSASLGMESIICKSYKGKYSHRHVLWTNEFFELFSDHCLLGTAFDQDSMANLAAYHHSAATRLQEIIQLADCLSSGSERQDDEASGDRQQYKKTRLHSIFDYLHLDGRQNCSQRYRYELRPMDANLESCFPTDMDNLIPKEGDKVISAYSELWKGFHDELRAVTVKNMADFLTVLLSVMEKYTWCIPSSTMDRPDISLFDHAKTTAAIASVLYQYHENKRDLGTASLSVHDDVEKFRLLVGDLSGIQGYIFNIRNVGIGGTAKRLRARSFFLSVLADVASHALLHDFGLPMTNLVIASGGKFFLLIPNIPEAETMITKRDKSFSRWLIDNLNGEIALNLASVPFSCRDFMNFNDVLKKANDALQISKERVLSGYLIADDGWRTDAFVLSGRDFSPEDEICPSCRKFPGLYQKEEGIVLCSHCERDIKLGTDLARATGVQFFRDTQGTYKIFDDYSFSLPRQKKEFSENAYLVQQFNDWRISATKVALKSRSFANYIPLFETLLCSSCKKTECADKNNATTGSPKYLTCLAEASQGRKMLGVLKADVDSLGLIFITGFKTEQEKCISRIITLSRLLEGFFTGRLYSLLSVEFRDIYTVYSGGDDLLMIGPWDQVLLFSRRLRNEFGRFTCNNPAFTLSAGLAVVKPRLPVYAAAGYAEELLDKSKRECAIDATAPKDQLSVLDDVIKWEEFDPAQQEAEQLAAWQAGKKLSMGFVRLLSDSAEHFRAFKDSGKTSYLRFVPMLTYGIARNIPPKETEIIKWAQDLTDLKNSKLRHLTFIANYSIQMNRS